jgi:hypothetical protein
VSSLPLELYHYHSIGVMRFRRFVQNCNWDKISSVISFTAASFGFVIHYPTQKQELPETNDA